MTEQRVRNPEVRGEAAPDPQPHDVREVIQDLDVAGDDARDIGGGRDPASGLPSGKRQH